MNIDDAREEFARQIYGCSFQSLSAWGRDHVYSQFPDPQNVQDTEIDSRAELVMVRRELAETKRRLASILEEYEDLWRENEDLKMIREEQL